MVYVRNEEVVMTELLTIPVQSDSWHVERLKDVDMYVRADTSIENRTDRLIGGNSSVHGQQQT